MPLKNNHANFISSGDIFKYGFKSNIKTFGVKIEAVNNESLDKEEIQTVVNESNAKLGAKIKYALGSFRVR